MPKQDSQYHNIKPKKGVIVVNFGSPEALTKKSIRLFLWRLLTDKRVVELPRIIWLPILCLIILPLRPRRLIHDYKRIWKKEGSPLLVDHHEITKKLQSCLKDVVVEEAHLYANPNLDMAWHKLKQAGVRDVLIFPLYPQYSSATTACVFDAWAKVMAKENFVPAVQIIQSYHDDQTYIDLLAKSVKAHWKASGQGDHLIFSFHGIPKQKFKAGDPYYCYCHKTMRLVAEKLKLDEKMYSLAFQSRFGKQEWLKPYLSDHIKSLITQGYKRIDVICPGFSIDCIETLHEIGCEYAEEAESLGGTLKLIPCLNNSSDSIGLYKKIILEKIS